MKPRPRTWPKYSPRWTEWRSRAARFTFMIYSRHRNILPASNLHQHLSSTGTPGQPSSSACASWYICRPHHWPMCLPLPARCEIVLSASSLARDGPTQATSASQHCTNINSPNLYRSPPSERLEGLRQRCGIHLTRRCDAADSQHSYLRLSSLAELFLWRWSKEKVRGAPCQRVGEVFLGGGVKTSAWHVVPIRYIFFCSVFFSFSHPLNNLSAGKLGVGTCGWGCWLDTMLSLSAVLSVYNTCSRQAHVWAESHRTWKKFNPGILIFSPSGVK